VLITVAIGYLWTLLGHQLQSKDLTSLIADVATPCLIVSTFNATRVSPEAVGALAGAAIVAIVCFALVGATVLWLSGLPIRTFLPSISFPNAGNLGLPLSLYAFGTEGLGYAIVFFSTASIANHTLGQAIAAGSANWRGLLRTPILYAVAFGLAVSFTWITLPGWLSTTIGLIGSMTVPLMLLMLGASLSRLRVASFGRAAFVSVIRIGCGTAVGFAVAAMFGLAGPMRAVLILQCAMPVAVYNFLYAQRWNNGPEDVAGVVVISTTLAAGTLPLLLAWLLVHP
jgi:predicted permease